MENNNSIKTLEQFISDKQSKWSEIIDVLSSKLTNFSDVIELQGLVCAKRQDALDYYYDLLSKLAEMSRDYNKIYADRYNFYKTGSGIRYNSDTAINAQIASDLRETKYQMELLDIHSKYMFNTIKTIDNLIFGINNRIEMEKMIEGVKK